MIYTFMPADLFFQSQLLLSHLSVVHANSVLEGVNVLQPLLHVCRPFHRLPRLQGEGHIYNFYSIRQFIIPRRITF